MINSTTKRKIIYTNTKHSKKTTIRKTRPSFITIVVYYYFLLCFIHQFLHGIFQIKKHNKKKPVTINLCTFLKFVPQLYHDRIKKFRYINENNIFCVKTKTALQVCNKISSVHLDTLQAYAASTSLHQWRN